MNASARYELQRQSLRLRLQANRLTLAQHDSRQMLVDDDVFPRSHTMRFLSNTPGLASFVLSEVAPFLLGRYLAKRKSRR